MKTTPEHHERIAKLTFSSVYPLYVAKIEKKGRTKEELLQVIEWHPFIAQAVNAGLYRRTQRLPQRQRFTQRFSFAMTVKDKKYRLSRHI